jgi:hypothetical protein
MKRSGYFRSQPPLSRFSTICAANLRNARFLIAVHTTGAQLPEGQFLALDADGYDLPNSWYLQLIGTATRMLRHEMPIDELPPTP